METANAKRMFGQYCAHALHRHARWDLLVADIEAEAQRRGLTFSQDSRAFVRKHFANRRRDAALRRAKRATVKLNRRIGRRP